jgi:hypothetical protein
MRTPLPIFTNVESYYRVLATYRIITSSFEFGVMCFNSPFLANPIWGSPKDAKHLASFFVYIFV